MTILLVVIQSYLIINNIFEGLSGLARCSLAIFMKNLPLTNESLLTLLPMNPSHQ